MKNRKKKLCPKCRTVLRIEKDLREYPYYCPKCDENMYNAEVIKTQKKKK